LTEENNTNLSDLPKEQTDPVHFLAEENNTDMTDEPQEQIEPVDFLAEAHNTDMTDELQEQTEPVDFLTEDHNTDMIDEPQEQIELVQCNKQPQYLDWSITVLAIALTGFFHQYYDEAENTSLRYLIPCIFAALGLYYGYKLWKNEH
jgi:hypothetical protein